jgi:hypothetical protein
VPSRALKQLVHRRRAIKCFDVLPARLVFEPIPPLFDPRDHPVTMPDDLRAGCAGPFWGWHIGVVYPVFDVVDGGFEKRFGDAKNMVAHQADRTVAIVDHTFCQPFIGDLPDIALCGAQHVQPFR